MSGRPLPDTLFRTREQFDRWYGQRQRKLKLHRPPRKDLATDCTGRTES